VSAEVAFDAATEWLEDAYAVLHAALDSAGLATDGPDGALYPEAFFTDGVGEVVAFTPVAADSARLATAATDRTRAIDLPAVRVATMLHEGSFDDLDQTYGALGTAVSELGVGIDGPIREIYLADDRAEVCWPVTSGSEP
jgi:effector-binding domain-containing protein